MPSLRSNLISPHPNLVYLVLPSSVSLLNFPITDLHTPPSPHLTSGKKKMDPKSLTTNDSVCVCISFMRPFSSDKKIPSLGSGKGLTTELLARPLIIYHILLLSVEFNWTLGSPIQMAQRDRVVPPDQTFNRTEIFIINALEIPSPRIER